MHDVDAVNAGYARLLLDEYLDDPESVPPEWRTLFENGDALRGLPGLDRLLERLPANGKGAGNGHHAPSRLEERPVTQPDPELLGGVAAGMALVKAFRMHGHLAAALDPLGSAPVGDPALDPLRLQPPLTAELQARVPASVLRIHVEGETLAEALPRLQETYCGSMAYEIEHIGDHFQRVWLRKAIESWRYRTPLPAEERLALYTRLCEVEGMERYLRRAFLGQKQFSLEGLDVLIPMLDLNGTAAPIEDYLVALGLLEGVAGDVDVLVPGHGSIGGADQVHARIDQDRAYVHALRDAGVPSDPRVGPSATFGKDWLPGVHERQLQRLARRGERDGTPG